MKKILIIQGGGLPNGNTDQFVKAFAKGTNEAGHEVEIISLSRTGSKGVLGATLVDAESHTFKRIVLMK